ncbi:MAG TPA: helix-turn-helix domain-containing protein, partial [Anaerovoracaceae bacterium]|nr:helix-turn-helix domain-containing protein [Anaerovoracaceae bacterium]
CTYEELYQKSVGIFGTLEAWFAKEQDKSNSGIAERMLDYVRKNYHKDISLFDLADYLNLSRNYVSTLFKSATGRNFKDYLSEYRYEIACGILREQPDIKIKEVAERVGCNTDILSRLFLRYAGMSPSDYQRREAQSGKP